MLGHRSQASPGPRYLLQPHSSSRVALPPGTVQQFHLSQSLCDHSSKNQPKEDTAYQHVVVVIFQDIKLLWGVHSGLVDVQAVRNNLERQHCEQVAQLPTETHLHLKIKNKKTSPHLQFWLQEEIIKQWAATWSEVTDLLATGYHITLLYPQIPQLYMEVFPLYSPNT